MPLTWIARFIKIAYGLNFIVTVHGSELPTLENDKRYPYLTEEALVKAKRIVPNSFWTRDWMEAVFTNKFKEQIRVIPGGVNLSAFPPTMDLNGIDRRYRLNGRKLVLFSGKLTKYKGVRYLISAAKNINAIVGIAGDGPTRKALEELTRELKLTNVRFFGHIDSNDLTKLYYRADVCVVPSIWDEPLGLVVLEAMAAKTPVVVTRKGGIPVAVTEGENGFFVRPRNSKEIAEKVNILLGDDALRATMGERARQTIIDHFTWKLIAESYERMYQKFRKKEQPEPAGPLDQFFNSILGKRKT
jgi:glycogen(starch) synthase